MNYTRTQVAIRCLRVISVVAIIYLGVVATTMFLLQRQLTKTSPLQFPELEELKEEAKKDRQNPALQEHIRKLDLIARRTYFMGKEQLSIGGWLLAGGLILLILTLGGTKVLSGRIPAPPGQLKPLERKPSSEVVALSALGVLAMLTVLGVFFLFSPVEPEGTGTGKSASKKGISSGGALEIKTPTPVKIEEKKYTAADFQKNWPGFRGPQRNGVSQNHAPVLGWDVTSGRGIKWKTKVPLTGYSSPLLWEKYLILTGGDKKERALFCYDADSGKLLWKHSATGIAGSPSKAPKVSSDTGYAASTPTTDGNRIFAAFATGDLLCTDFKGNRLWAKNLGVPHNPYGYSSSLLMADHRLIVQYDDEKKQILYCFEPSSGKVLWKKERKSHISWSSPLYIPKVKKGLIVLLTCKTVEGYHLETGNQAWSIPCLDGEVAPSPAFAGGKLFVASAGACAAAIDPVKGKILWKQDSVVLPDVSSPVAFKDLFFLFATGGTLTCLDGLTGKLLWEKDLPQGFYSSPQLIGDRIVAFNMKGTMLVVRPDRKKLIIEHRLDLKEKVVTTPAFGRGKMWVRGSNYLYCMESAPDKK